MVVVLVLRVSERRRKADVSDVGGGTSSANGYRKIVVYVGRNRLPEPQQGERGLCVLIGNPERVERVDRVDRYEGIYCVYLQS